MRWSDRVQEALDIPTWRSDEATVVLDLAREVAHNSERAYAPLTAYMLGLAVGRELGEGDTQSRSELCGRLAAVLSDAIRAAAEDADA